MKPIEWKKMEWGEECRIDGYLIGEVRYNEGTFEHDWTCFLPSSKDGGYTTGSHLYPENAKASLERRIKKWFNAVV